MYTKQILVALAMTAGSAYAGFSTTMWAIDRPSNSVPFIQTLKTTLLVPAVPKTQGIFLWPGMYSADGQLVQTILTNGPDYVSGACGQPKGTNVWCVQSYQENQMNQPQGTGAAVKVNPGDYLEITYNWDAGAGNTTQQTVLKSTGKVITSLSWPGGPGYSLSDMIECHAAAPNTPEHAYYNTTITLNEQETAFNSTLHAENVTPTSFTSTDGGKTWFIGEIVLGASSCKCNPSGAC